MRWCLDLWLTAIVERSRGTGRVSTRFGLHNLLCLHRVWTILLKSLQCVVQRMPSAVGEKWDWSGMLLFDGHR